MMKHPMIKSIMIITIVLVSLAGTSMTAWTEEIPEFNRKIASVNGFLITVKDFKWAFDSEEQRLVSSGELLGDKEILDLKRVVLQRLINRELLYQESRKQNIEIPQSRIEDEFSKMRASMITDIDLETIEKELGMSEKDIKDEFRRVFAIDELMKKALVIDTVITENQMKEFYESNKEKFILPGKPMVSHILILVNNDFTDVEKADARKKIEAAKMELEGGKNFEDLARAYSEGPSGSRGGSIGYIKKGQTVKEFENAAYALKPGEVSDIVETQYGYHLIKVTDKMPDFIFQYDDIKEHIETFIKQERNQKSELAYIAELKKGAIIEIFEDPKTIVWQP